MAKTWRRTALITALTLVAAVVVVATIAHLPMLQALRVVGGLTVVAVVPGLAVGLVLFPKSLGLALLTAVPLSVATLPLVMFCLYRLLRLPISTGSVLVGVTSILVASWGFSFLAKKYSWLRS